MGHAMLVWAELRIGAPLVTPAGLQCRRFKLPIHYPGMDAVTGDGIESSLLTCVTSSTRMRAGPQSQTSMHTRNVQESL
jgi:hypothetical protein